MTVKVKICGICTLDIAQKAILAGADYLGFNFVATSPRYINPNDATKIIPKIKGKVQTVGVFQNTSTNTVNVVASQLRLDFVQLHGNETVNYIKKINTPVIKVITENENPYKYAGIYSLLLDRANRQGRLVDTQIAADIAKAFRIFLAGGLTVNNVTDAVNAVRPFAVDVASGVETNGSTDPDKVIAFINQARKANYE